MKKQNNLNFIIYHTLLLTLGLFLVCNNYVMRVDSKSSIILLLIPSIISIICLLFLPNKISTSFKKNKFISLTLSLYYIISTSLFISLATYIIIFYFFSNMNFLMLSLLLLLMVFLFSTFNKKAIYNVGLLILIITFLLNFVFLFNTSLGELNLIYNVINSKITLVNSLKSLCLLFIFLDPIVFYYNNIIDNKNNIKRNIIISIICSSLISILSIGINYLFYSHQYLQTLIYPAFSSIFLFLGPEFIDHFSIMILINILVFIYVKCSLNLNSISKNSSLNIFSCLLIYLLIIFMFNIFNSYTKLTFFFGIILTILILIIYMFTIFKNKRKAKCRNLN